MSELQDMRDPASKHKVKSDGRHHCGPLIFTGTHTHKMQVHILLQGLVIFRFIYLFNLCVLRYMSVRGQGTTCYNQFSAFTRNGTHLTGLVAHAFTHLVIVSAQEMEYF